MQPPHPRLPIVRRLPARVARFPADSRRLRPLVLFSALLATLLIGAPPQACAEENAAQRSAEGEQEQRNKRSHPPREDEQHDLEEQPNGPPPQGKQRRESGLVPFFPDWIPLGPPWDKAVEATRRRPPTMPRPETMIGGEGPGAVPPPDLKVPGAEEKRWSFVPVPIIMADPNLGFGFGLMPVVLVHPQERIEWIFAPSVRWNEILGTGLTSRVFFYPTVHEELRLINDINTGGAFEHRGRFHGRDRFIPRSDFHAGAYAVRDPTRRFFGLGSETPEEAETDYQIREGSLWADIGYRVLDELRIATTLRWRHVRRLRRGDIARTDDTIDRFPLVPGVLAGSTDVLAVGARLTLDLRDDPTIPSRGLLVDLLFEGADPQLFGDAGFLRWRAQVVAHVPLIDDTWIGSFRFGYHQVVNQEALPFWELPTLGGKDRLRGYGVGRFTGDAYLVFSAEERVRLFETVLRQNRVRLEAAAFADLGRVYGRGDALTANHWSFVPGFGFRILLPDSGIVARADIGYGDEGSAIFLVLGYPF